MDDDLIAFWRKLNECNVRFVMIGVLAIRFQGYNRATDDIDLWLEDLPENRKNLRKAFKELGYGDYPQVETMQFVTGWTSFYAAGITLDIITGMRGLEEVSFQECYDQALVADIENIKVRFLNINHLILNKKAVNRPKDQVDLIYLEKLKKLKGIE